MPDAGVRLCRQCRRVNPSEAVYCHHDGVHLEGRSDEGTADKRAINAGTRPFSVPFVLPSGKECHNFNELALACQADSKGAFELLRTGHLEAFLAAQGRADLARAARSAARATDRLRGLDEFIGRLPATGLKPPKLRVTPAVLDLGTMRLGEEKRCELVLQNDGMRLLSGSASCDATWLSLADAAELRSKLFECTARTTLPVRVVGRELRAFEKPHETQILLDSNGGQVAVTVRVYVPVKPFPEGVLSGALSPREAAHKAREAPKEAGELIQSGALARWYEANGWTYPVLGPTATGVAAVQQWLEALGLVRTPRVDISEDTIRLSGRVGEKIEYSLAVVTQENRAAIAFGTSNQPWLRVGATIFRGRSAFVPLTIAPIPGNPGEVLQAVVSVTANGGQRFTVPVTLQVSERSAAIKAVPLPSPVVAAEVKKPQPSVAALPPPNTPPPPVAPVMPVAAVPAPAQPLKAPPDGRSGWPWWFTLFPAALLLALIGGAGIHDYLTPPPVARNLPDGDQPLDATPRIAIQFHEVKRGDDLEKLYLTDPQPTLRFGVVMLHNSKTIGKGINIRRLTFDPWGRTNNTCLRLDDKDERLFGSSTGRWEESAAKSWKDQQAHEHEGVKSVWICDDKRIEVTQLVELVRGEQSQLLDTCRVRYQLLNRDNRPHQLGLRFLLDSFIGDNDGVPFTIPGESALCDTLKDLPKDAKDKKLPDFLQALEKPDLDQPGTIAHVRLKLENLEVPERVTLGAWPSEKLRVLDRQAAGPATLWNVPLLPLKSLGLNDSAITIYWKEQPLQAGDTREVGFEYGVWNLVSQGNRLAATVDGVFRPEGQLTVVAYLKRSPDENPNETVSLTLPENFKLLEGAETQAIPNLPKGAKSDNFPVTWKVQAGLLGKYAFTVKTNTGLSQALPVEIRKSILD